MDEKKNNTDKTEVRARRPVRPDRWFWLLTTLAVVNFVVCWIYLLLAGPPEVADKSRPDRQLEAESILPEQDAYSANEIPLEDDSHTEKAGHLQVGSKGKVLIVRGILTVFSLGMDELAKKLRKEGYDVQVTTAAKSNHTAKRMRDDISRHGIDSPLIIIGHSLGGDLAPKLAQTFGEKRVPVDLLVMLDSTMPSSPPSNVKRCVNMYQDNGTPDWARVFRGTRINAQSSKTEMINIDIRKLAGKDKTSGINHFNIDANPWIHDLIVQTLSSVDSVPVNASGRLPAIKKNPEQANRSQQSLYRQSPARPGQRPSQRRR